MEYTGFHSAFEALIKSLSGQKETEPIKKFINELKEFLKHLDSTDQSSVNLILNDFEAQTQEPMFQEVGMILRKFHDQMVTIKEGIPNNLGMLADIELLDVEGKLKHILTMTDNAANKTMDLAETITEDINQQNDSNLKLLNELKTSAEKIDSGLLDQINLLIQNNTNSHQEIQAKLTEILIAQDYQDLTGQVINKILNLLKTLEDDLSSLIKKFGKLTKHEKKESDINLKGPLEEGHTEKKSQDDVNDLLSQFGF